MRRLPPAVAPTLGHYFPKLWLLAWREVGCWSGNKIRVYFCFAIVYLQIAFRRRDNHSSLLKSSCSQAIRNLTNPSSAWPTSSSSLGKFVFWQPHSIFAARVAVPTRFHQVQQWLGLAVLAGPVNCSKLQMCSYSSLLQVVGMIPREVQANQ